MQFVYNIHLTKGSKIFLKKRSISVLSKKWKQRVCNHLTRKPSLQRSMAFVRFTMPCCTGRHSQFLSLRFNLVKCSNDPKSTVSLLNFFYWWFSSF
jgi:hypothetical protein